MKGVDVKHLKDNLSQYLEQVREGEVVYVTDHDEIIAELHKPTPVTAPVPSRWEAFLLGEERKGTIVPAKRTVSTVREDIKQLKYKRPIGGLTPQELLNEIRTDRFE